VTIIVDVDSGSMIVVVVDDEFKSEKRIFKYFRLLLRNSQEQL